MKMDTRTQYGVYTAIVWLVMSIALFFIASFCRSTPFIEDIVDVIALPIFMFTTTIVWFFIGFNIRDKYLKELYYYVSESSELNKIKIEKEFKRYFIFQRSRMFGFLFLTAIPWYIFSPIRQSLGLKDYIILSLLFLLALVFFVIYFRGKRKYTQ